jgi:hypothetical protein
MGWLFRTEKVEAGKGKEEQKKVEARKGKKEFGRKS